MSESEEHELEGRQRTGLYGIGRALRATYDAENHDSLGNDLTGLMLQLARVDDEASPSPAPAAPPAPRADGHHRPSWLARVFGW